ncbi:hypothetical protein [Ralstonia phage RP13]|nr:hypothetical protein [Ralstonia phage RP13]
MNTKIKTLAEINESSADTQANVYVEKYQDQIDTYESHSIKTRVNESLSPYEIVAVGQQLDQFQNYVQFCESQGNLGSLGAIPQIALDVITASVGASILPLLASIQPMAEEHGIVYYKAMKAMQIDGGYNTGDIISSPLQRDNPGDGTLGGNRKQSTIATTAASTLTYTGTFPSVPLRPYRITVNVPGIGFGQDDGAGNLLGFGFSGTVNYTTGAFSITFPTQPATGVAISAIYDIDVDSAAAIDKVQATLQTKDIKAQIWALASDVGAFANFAFSQRFGRSASDEVAADLTNELTRVLNTNAIKAILGNLPADSGASAYTHWARTPASGISYAEHKLTFIDALASAEATVHAQSGAPSANRYICGKTAAAVLRGMPDFQIAPDAGNVSVGLYGYYDGVPVIRATGVVADTEMILVSNAGNYFAAPLAYAPFMPLMVTNTVQSPSNPFRQTTAAAVWSGMTALNGNLTTKIVFDA